jgi:hypothetical protein
VPSTTVIGPAEHLSSLAARGVEDQTRAFENTDALGALEAITEERPDVVLIEHGFSDSSSGAPLIKRIKADATLAACNIRVVGPDPNGRDTEKGATQSAAPGRAISARAVASPAAVAAAPPSTPTTASKLDQRSTRCAPRAVMPEGTMYKLTAIHRHSSTCHLSEHRSSRRRA